MQNRPMAGQPAHNPGLMQQHMSPQQAVAGMQPPMHQIHPSHINPAMQMDPAMVQGMPPGSLPIGMVPRRQMYTAPNVGSPHIQTQSGPPGQPRQHEQQPDDDTMYTVSLLLTWGELQNPKIKFIAFT